ncbi:hypothetical protein SAMN04488121_102465 [Chitinophaga filiformis]|uniref:Uncharacterized protein n=1 Tax=Chitinophaga filiformis TaxID=104663 RepID=A0A1G7MLR9_CHIFI|nr:hypothetical protein SAMN04488121_102465 [Chitinophaga filiformis]
MDQNQHELLLLIESAITTIENKRRKTTTEQDVYQKLLVAREKAKQTKGKKGLGILLEIVGDIFKCISP